MINVLMITIYVNLFFVVRIYQIYLVETLSTLNTYPFYFKKRYCNRWWFLWSLLFQLAIFLEIIECFEIKKSPW